MHNSELGEENLKLVHVSYSGVPIWEGEKGKACPMCHKGIRFILDEKYNPPEGIDPNMKKAKCTTCEKYFYIIAKGR